MPRGRPGTPEAAATGAIEGGRRADLLLLNGDPLADVNRLLHPDAIAAVWLAGERQAIQRRSCDRQRVADLLGGPAPSA